MRLVLVLLIAVAVLLPAPPTKAQFCADDYVTVDTIVGTIIDIIPSPDPFKSADIFVRGPGSCSPLWMQVLKADAEQCRVGDRIRAMGIITSDPDTSSWQINPERNEYMLLGQDYTCTRSSE